MMMRAAGASRRVFQILDRVSPMPKSGNLCPLGLVIRFCPSKLALGKSLLV